MFRSQLLLDNPVKVESHVSLSAASLEGFLAHAAAAVGL
jgi:hypothetical protein